VADATINIDVKVSPPDPLGQLVKQTKEAETETGSLASAFGKLGAVIAGLGALKGTFDFVLGATRQMEDLTTQFIAFTGSAEGAANQLEALSQFASQSPFELAEIATANRTLLAFGSSTKQSLEQLRQLGEVAAATGTDLSELATIFGQIQAEGKLTGERFNQLVERGVNIGPILAQSLGVAQSSLVKLRSEGKITSDEVAKAFQKMTSEGGQFFGSTERLSKTISGSLSTLKDNFTILASTVGSSAVPAFTSLVNIISKAVEGNIAYLKEQQKIANENETQKRIRAIGVEVDTLTKQLEDLKKSQAAGFSFFGDDPLKIASDIDVVTTSIRQLSLERLQLAKKQGSADLAKQVEADNKEAEIAQQKANEKKLALLQEQAAKEKEAADKIATERATKIQETEANITQIELQEEAVRQAIRAEQAGANKQAALDALNQREAELTSAKLTAEATRADLLLQFDQAELLRAQDKQNKLSEITKAGEAKRLADIKKAKDDDLNVNKGTTEALKKFEEQSYTQRVDTARTGLSAIASLQKSGNRDAFNIGKRAAQAQVLLDIPKAAFAAYTSLIGVPFVGPVLAPLAAAAAVFAGTQQLRQIEAQQPPGFAEGGLVPGTGNKDTVPALLTPGEVVVPKKNFADLQQGMVQGSIASDQVILLQQGNAITGKILDELTFGTVNEKLTIMIKLLNDTVGGLDKIAVAAAAASSPATTEANVAEIQQNQPRPSGYGSDPGRPKEIKRSTPQQTA
jgi:tape measure domain-containing protein